MEAEDSSPKRGEALSDEEAFRLARRKLLRTGAYVTPAVLATLMASGSWAQTSCGPGKPCTPTDPTCNPNTCGPKS